MCAEYVFMGTVPALFIGMILACLLIKAFGP